VKFYDIFWSGAFDPNPVSAVRLPFVVLVLHGNFVTEFFLELGTTFDLIARNVAPSSRRSSEEKETKNDGYSHRGIALTKIRGYFVDQRRTCFLSNTPLLG
jgi:hypothetical protein